MLKRLHMIGLFAAALALTGGVASAQDSAVADTLQIDQYSCRDLLELSGDERDFVLVFMHGFMSGKLGELTFDTMKLADATDEVVSACIDNPDGMLLAAFEAARG
jgi:hypothetical protein